MNKTKKILAPETHTDLQIMEEVLKAVKEGKDITWKLTDDSSNILTNTYKAIEGFEYYQCSSYVNNELCSDGESSISKSDLLSAIFYTSFHSYQKNIIQMQGIIIS